MQTQSRFSLDFVKSYAIVEYYGISLFRFCRANCVITDLPELIPLLKNNIDVNQEELRGTVRAETLNWEDGSSWNHPAPDYVMIADCIYYDAVIIIP